MYLYTVNVVNKDHCLSNNQVLIQSSEDFHHDNLEDNVESIYCVAGDWDLKTSTLKAISVKDGQLD
ncbi:hypothetical protein EMPG_12718 [Blastomyces silverae]|uniref:Uncharacterized protein n=1 Tax=Blastomyces silverae TaxID=2060906 RepID=A0A0H1BSU4_9EURO|nr:hypothetical protein EMPG_12718 [Blastomyces silverae]